MVLGEIVAGLTATDYGLKLLNRIRDLSETTNNIELLEAITELRETLDKVKNENLDLKQEIMELNKKLTLKESLQLKNGMFWHNDDKTPYCQVCLEKDDKPIHLEYVPGNQSFNSFYKCNVCHNHYPEDPNKPEPEIHIPDSYSPF